MYKRQVAALFDMECVVYMGAEDVERQSLNAYRMELLGAKVHAVELSLIHIFLTNKKSTHII